MSCPTCDHTMQRPGPIKDAPIFWCPRCGTLVSEGDVGTPMLVIRVGMLKKVMEQRVGFHEWDKHAWHTIGINESIDVPANRPNYP